MPKRRLAVCDSWIPVLLGNHKLIVGDALNSGMRVWRIQVGGAVTHLAYPRLLRQLEHFGQPVSRDDKQLNQITLSTVLTVLTVSRIPFVRARETDAILTLLAGSSRKENLA